MSHNVIEMLECIQRDISELKMYGKEVLNVSEACQFLSLSSSHLYKLTCTNQIPHYQPNGKKLYFKKSELEEWLTRTKESNVESIDTLAANYVLEHSMKGGRR